MPVRLLLLCHSPLFSLEVLGQGVGLGLFPDQPLLQKQVLLLQLANDLVLDDRTLRHLTPMLVHVHDRVQIVILVILIAADQAANHGLALPLQGHACDFIATLHPELLLFPLLPLSILDQCLHLKVFLSQLLSHLIL